MKKLVFVLVSIMLLGIGSASAQVVWGARVGLSKPTLSSDNEAMEGKYGLELGPVLYYSIKNNWYLNSGAMFSYKSFEFGGESLTAGFVDIPLNIGYSFPIGKLSFYAQAGPFVGIKLFDEYTYDNSYYDEAEAESGLLSRFHAGLGIMAGINIQRFKIELGYQAGFTNILNTEYADVSANLSSLFLGVSYVF